MPVPRPSACVDPSALEPEVRARLADQLYQVHRTVFATPTRSDFQRYVVDSPADHTRIQVYTDAGGSPVGYFAHHLFLLEIDGAPLAVHRAETGLLPEYRGGAACAAFLARRLSAAVARHPGRDHMFFACLTHPSSYCGLSRHFPQIWPCPDTPTPVEVQSRMLGLARAFGLERPEGAGELVRTVGWVTRDRGHHRSRWDDSADPRAALYRTMNPTFREGTGLLTLIPVSPAAIVNGPAT